MAIGEYVPDYLKPLNFVNVKEMQTNIWKLEHMVFPVKVRYIDVLNHGELKVYGMVSSGDEYEDRCNALETVTINATIPKMLEMYRKHIVFYLTDKTDDETIYSIIHQHLYDWNQYAQQQHNFLVKKEIPMNDLRDLSDLATIIYSQRLQSLDVPKPIHYRNFSEIKELDFLSIGFQKPEPTQETKEEDKPPHLQHTSALTMVFNRR